MYWISDVVSSDLTVIDRLAVADSQRTISIQLPELHLFVKLFSIADTVADHIEQLIKNLDLRCLIGIRTIKRWESRNARQDIIFRIIKLRHRLLNPLLECLATAGCFELADSFVVDPGDNEQSREGNRPQTKQEERSEERRVGEECVRTGRARWT